MTRSSRFRAALFLFGAGLPPMVASAAPVEAARQGRADARLRALYDGYAAWDSKESGYFEDSRG
jgi:hypothetical protein